MRQILLAALTVAMVAQPVQQDDDRQIANFFAPGGYGGGFIVAPASAGADSILLEDGSSYILMETSDKILLE
jgi:hypothetical protein